MAVLNALLRGKLPSGQVISERLLKVRWAFKSSYNLLGRLSSSVLQKESAAVAIMVRIGPGNHFIFFVRIHSPQEAVEM